MCCRLKFPVQYSEIEASVAGGYLESVYRTESEELREWAEATFALNAGDDAVLLVETMNEWIHRSIRYRRRDDRGVQSPLETLRLGSGSCRDMATLLLEAARALRLAARFASGYLGWHRLPRWSGGDPRLGGGLFSQSMDGLAATRALAREHQKNTLFAVSVRIHAGSCRSVATTLAPDAATLQWTSAWISSHWRQQIEQDQERCTHPFLTSTDGFQNELQGKLRKYEAIAIPNFGYIA